MPNRRFVKIVNALLEVVALARSGEQPFPGVLEKFDPCPNECLRQIDDQIDDPEMRDSLETRIRTILWPAPVEVQLVPPVGSAGYAPGFPVGINRPTLPKLLAEGYSQWDATRMMLRSWGGRGAEKHGIKTGL